MPDWHTTAELPAPERLIDRMIGQGRAVEVVRLAAAQRRHVFLVGEPGTGKSMLAQAMSELLPDHPLEDVLLLPGTPDRVTPRACVVPAGTGRRAYVAARDSAPAARQAADALCALAALAVVGVAVWYTVARATAWPALTGAAALLALYPAWRRLRRSAVPVVPHLLVDNGGRSRAPFVDASGAGAGALFGDVRHDPFQSGGRESPPHRLVEAGALHRAHGGVLFIDEAALLSAESQQALLTGLQERRLPITGRNPLSSGSTVRTEPIPCDVVLVLAANPADLERLHPALRSRIRGEGYEVVMASAVEDTDEHRHALARFVAQEVRNDGRIPHFDRAAVMAVIAEASRRGGAGRLTSRLRELGGLVRAAGDLARGDAAPIVSSGHVERALGLAVSAEEQLAAAFTDTEAAAAGARPARVLHAR